MELLGQRQRYGQPLLVEVVGAGVDVDADAVIVVIPAVIDVKAGVEGARGVAGPGGGRGGRDDHVLAVPHPPVPGRLSPVAPCPVPRLARRVWPELEQYDSREEEAEGDQEENDQVVLLGFGRSPLVDEPVVPAVST